MRVTAIQNREYFDVYIGRAFGGFPASIWGNPFKIGRDGSGTEVLAKYEAHIRNNPDLMAQLSTLKGKILACWCKTKAKPHAPCHGDVLVKLVKELEGEK